MVTKWTRRMNTALAVVLAVALAACTPDATAPARLLTPASDPSRASASTSEPAVYESADDPRLHAWLEREKLRLDEKMKGSQRIYDSLQVVWQEFVRQNPQGSSELLYCDPIQYVSTTKIVGPEGGDIDFGPHKLSVPKGALSGYTVVTAEAPVAIVVEAKFSPHGLVFLEQPELTLSYKHCNRPREFTKRIVYVDEDRQVVEHVQSVDVKRDGLVRGWIDHFSSYIIAY